jgi:Nucleotidyltransferase
VAPDGIAGTSGKIIVMDYGRLPIDEQVAAFQAVLRRNQVLAEVLSRAAVLDLPGWYLVAGCLYQTVWNVVTGQPPEAGILDYGPMGAIWVSIRSKQFDRRPGFWRTI